jgi:hypothetical protein
VDHLSFSRRDEPLSRLIGRQTGAGLVQQNDAGMTHECHRDIHTTPIPVSDRVATMVEVQEVKFRITAPLLALLSSIALAGCGSSGSWSAAGSNNSGGSRHQLERRPRRQQLWVERLVGFTTRDQADPADRGSRRRVRQGAIPGVRTQSAPIPMASTVPPTKPNKAATSGDHPQPSEAIASGPQHHRRTLSDQGSRDPAVSGKPDPQRHDGENCSAHQNRLMIRAADHRRHLEPED